MEFIIPMIALGGVFAISKKKKQAKYYGVVMFFHRWGICFTKIQAYFQLVNY